MDDLSFGEWLREARIEKDITLRSLAGQLGITPAYLSDIENGHRIPAEDVIQKLTDALELDFEEAMVRAGRFGQETENYVRRNTEAVRLMREVSAANFTPEQLRALSDQVKNQSKQKRQNEPK